MFLTTASSQSVFGKAYKYFDLKTVFLLSVGIFELGSLLCGMQIPPISLGSAEPKNSRC